MKNTLNNIFKEADKNYKVIAYTYKILEKSYDLKIPIHSAGQWILDNMYIIDQEYEEIKENKRVLKNKRLPIVKTHDGDKYISIFYLAYELVEKNSGYVDQNLILNILKEHQKLSYLTSEELNLFILMLKIALIKFIARICTNISNAQLKKLEVEEIIEAESKDGKLSKELSNQFKYFKTFREHMLDSSNIKSTNTAFVEYMAYRLKELGLKGEKYFNTLKDEAEKIGFTIDEAIIKEHMEVAKTTELIGRAILAFKQIRGINFREIFEKVNKIDETLKEDYTNEFKKCDYKTKNRYRKYIILLAKKYNLSEVYVAKKAVECSIKYKKHVGFFLIGDYKYLLKKALNKPYVIDLFNLKVVSKIKQPLYILGILILSLEFTLIACNLLVKTTEAWIIVVSVLTLFGFFLEIVSKFMDYLIRKCMIPETLPRFDFAKTVDSKYPTYVVMPTVISSIEKLDDMINKMEVTYLANRSENMYYMLLGDCMQSDKKTIAIDSKIVEYAKYKLDILNNKYKTEHKLFNFMYRKRIYSECEKCYMGWERKRGALIEFNKLILSKLTIKERQEKMYLIYDDIIAAKYAITVDEDTQLSLNTAKDLVSIIAHPLNAPILSKNKKIVEKGYGLIQPSVGLDIEAANKSIFSKTFGGFGGLDIYTTAVSNVYQDVFGEAIFCGKGIYDVKLFDEIVTPNIPENLVLSHDLLEGSILRSGLASDIELQDGFPNNYIAYMKRNHRWYRGDMQIIKWLISPNSCLNLLSKWKIFDNLRRPFIDVIVIVALLTSACVSSSLFTGVILISFLTVNFGYILSVVDTLIFGRFRHSKELQYIPIIHGIQADLLNMFFNFVTIPYRAYMCISAFIVSLYRMCISHKNLLQWTTGEVLEKKSKNIISYYLINMLPNLIISIILIILPFIFNIYNSYYYIFNIFMAISFFAAPFFAYLLGQDHLLSIRERLDDKQNEEIIEIARRTWKFFDIMSSEVNNYLPTDNYQENRRIKIVNRTSSTNIGFAILSIIDAYDLKFISFSETIERLTKLFTTIMKLEKWNGHLYNWYNIKTLETLRPRFVSTVDSGNFVACLYVLKEFLNNILLDKNYNIEKDVINDGYRIQIKLLIDNTVKLIDETDFTKLYNTSLNLFSIGYAEENGKLIDSYYDMLMSESRITSLIAIATRQITSKHWFALSRKLIKVDGYKGLISWSGTAFEYFMPYLFNKSYEHTLIDQSLFFTKYSNIKYAKANNTPWGVSESAFAVKDNDLNYQYQAFGIPWLGLKRGLNDYCVVAPYASLLMLEFDPKKVYKNIRKLKKLGAYSSYGFFESIDYTKEHLGKDVNLEVATTYMAHHQGMILTAINNYINNGIIQNRFHGNPEIKACEILLKERERMKANLKKESNKKENTFKQKNTNQYTNFVECNIEDRKKDNINILDTPKIAILKGNNLSTIITSNGSSYLKYKDKIVNKQKYTNFTGNGNYVFLTDKTTGKQISITDCDLDSQFNKCANKSIWTASLNKVETYLETSELEVSSTIFLAPEYNMEIKKISIYNNSNTRREILINTYVEPAMTDYMSNAVHPSFNSLQIETFYDEELDSLIASKRKKNDEDQELYIYTKLLGIDLEKDYETEKQKIYNKPEEAYDGPADKYPLWPVLSYRARIILDSHERQEFSYILGVADSKYKISNAIVNLDNILIEEQLRLSEELNTVIARYLKLEAGVAQVYNNIIKDVIFTKPVKNDEKLWNIKVSQSMLWKYSISGDLPIILVYVDKIEDAGIINEVLNFMDYVKNRKIDLDIIILINEKQKQFGPVYTYIKTRIDRFAFVEYTKGNIYILNITCLQKEEIELLTYLSKRYITNANEFMVIKESNDISDNLINKKSEENKEESNDEV